MDEEEHLLVEETFLQSLCEDSVEGGSHHGGRGGEEQDPEPSFRDFWEKSVEVDAMLRDLNGRAPNLNLNPGHGLNDELGQPRSSAPPSVGFVGLAHTTTTATTTTTPAVGQVGMGAGGSLGDPRAHGRIAASDLHNINARHQSEAQPHHHHLEDTTATPLVAAAMNGDISSVEVTAFLESQYMHSATSPAFSRLWGLTLQLQDGVSGIMANDVSNATHEQLHMPTSTSSQSQSQSYAVPQQYGAASSSSYRPSRSFQSYLLGDDELRQHQQQQQQQQQTRMLHTTPMARHGMHQSDMPTGAPISPQVLQVLTERYNMPPSQSPIHSANSRNPTPNTHSNNTHSNNNNSMQGRHPSPLNAHRRLSPSPYSMGQGRGSGRRSRQADALFEASLAQQQEHNGRLKARLNSLLSY